MANARTIAQAIEDAAKTAPTRGFRFVPESGVPGTRGVTETSEASFSFTAIERASARYGGALQALGLRKGDRVALILPANEDFVLCFFGAIVAGIIPVPIYPPLGPGQLQTYLDNTRHIVEKSGARALITPAKIKRLLGTVQSACPALEQVVAVEAIRESMEALRPEKITLDDIAFLQFTSGSTSRPKGVSLTHANLAANLACIMDDGLAAREGDVGVSWLPLYHDMGLIGFVIAPLYYRVPTVYLSPLLFLKRPITWFQTITRHKGTIAYAPNFAYALCLKRIREKDLEGIDLSSWRVAGCGAEPIRPETLETFASTYAGVGFKKSAFVPSYGMAESSLAIAFSNLDQGPKVLALDGPTLWSEGVVKLADDIPPRSGLDNPDTVVRLVSCGRAFPEHQIRIFDPDDVTSEHPLEERKVGEIRISGPSVMHGYWEDVERTREAFAGPFLRTGDLGFLHDNELYICGRIKEVVIVNGRNYYPQDMEWEASQVPGVRKGSVIAFGSRHPSGIEADRERVVIAFETQDAHDMAQTQRISKEIRKSVQDGLGLTIDDVVALPAGTLPKTSSGKLQRAKTRTLYEAGELTDQAPTKREGSRLELAKHAARSQLSYFKLAVLGGRRKREE
ncbi:fatty acyl-AMP ligase [Pendulispora brunnea]|uniref:Fatty acyl-AMP ligase n=1 Tax=Pendulispora brunnea TaxID=2905690 RepID=A0ABZ2KKW7_9BACT